MDIRRYFAPLVAALEAAIRERFMDPRHREMWEVVHQIDDVIGAIESAPLWSSETRGFATL